MQKKKFWNFFHFVHANTHIPAYMFFYFVTEGFFFNYIFTISHTHNNLTCWKIEKNIHQLNSIVAVFQSNFLEFEQLFLSFRKIFPTCERDISIAVYIEEYCTNKIENYSEQRRTLRRCNVSTANDLKASRELFKRTSVVFWRSIPLLSN